VRWYGLAATRGSEAGRRALDRLTNPAKTQDPVRQEPIQFPDQEQPLQHSETER